VRVLHSQVALDRDQDGATDRCRALGWLCARPRPRRSFRESASGKQRTICAEQEAPAETVEDDIDTVSGQLTKPCGTER
jgi:hypothetical protein